MSGVRQVVDRNLPGESIGNDALALGAHLSAAGVANELVELLPQKTNTGLYSDLQDASTTSESDTLLLHTREPNLLHEQFTRWRGPVVLREHGAWWTPGRFDADPQGAAEWHHSEKMLHPLYQRADSVLATSDASANRAVRLGASPERVRVVPPLFPADQFSSMSSRRNNQDPNILVVGRLDSHAGLGASLASFHVLASSLLPDAQLTVVGRSEPAWLYAAINETIGSRRLRARLLGHVSQAVLIEEFASAHAILVLSEASGFAVRIAEAQLAAVPVVTRVGAVSAEVPFGEHDAVAKTVAQAGLVLGSNDNDIVVAQALQHVITDQTFRDQCATHGRLAVSRFDPATNAKLAISIVRDLW